MKQFLKLPQLMDFTEQFKSAMEEWERTVYSAKSEKIVKKAEKKIERTINFTDYYIFENLNFRPHDIPRIFKIIKNYYLIHLPIYQEFKIDQSRWDFIEDDIRNYCEKRYLDYIIEFHHGGFSKS